MTQQTPGRQESSRPHGGRGQPIVVGVDGSLAGMLLGSVSQHCVQHAPCPVLVVPAVPQPSPATAPDTAG